MNDATDTTGSESTPVGVVLDGPGGGLVPTGGRAGAEGAPKRILTQEDRARVDKIKETVDVTDPNMVVQYGLPAQNKIAAFADSLLADLRTQDADATGQAMTELLARVKELDVDGLTKGSQGSRIPLIGRFVDRVKRFDARYQKLSATVDRLLTALERARMGLLKDVTVLDKMYELNLEHLRQLDLYIATGEEILQELETTRVPSLQHIETLQKVNDELVSTLEETIRIQEEGHSRRIQVETELLRLQSDLKQKLIELRG